MHEASMNEFIKLIKSPFNNWILIIFIIITTVHFFHNSVSNANHCKSVFQLPNPTNSPKSIDTITDELVDFYFQSVIGNSYHNFFIKRNESDRNQVGLNFNFNENITAQNKLITELNELHILYGEFAIKQYYQKIKQRLSRFSQLQKENEKAQPKYWQERLRFHNLKTGSFMMGKPDQQTETTISKPFAMSATLTTQFVWRKIAELANERFPQKYKIDTNPSYFKSDFHPVESVSYDQVLNWINALNDLSIIGDSLLVEILPQHKVGDKFRLPFDSEWEFAASGGGKNSDLIIIGSYEYQLSDYAWYSLNSDGSTHPVAEKKPFFINGQRFFDLYGNVREIVIIDPESNLHLHKNALMEARGLNYNNTGKRFNVLSSIDQWYQKKKADKLFQKFISKGTIFLSRGGSWYDESGTLLPSYRHIEINPKSLPSAVLGFRLVKEEN